MSSISQQARGLVSDGRTTRVALLSGAVFLVSMVLGVYLSRVSEPSSTGSDAVVAEMPRTQSMTTAPQVQSSPTIVPEQQWNLVAEASTDFTGRSIDRSVWDLYEGKGNAGVGFRRISALSVRDNMLRIKAVGDVSGGLSQKFSQVHGRWVVRARMEKGSGYGPAILLWPDSENWPVDGEIDFLELPKGDRALAVMTTHWGTNNSQVSKSVPGDYSEWHTFTVDWLKDRLVFYIDGVEYWRVTKPEAIPTKPMHLAIQNDVGACGSWIGCRDANTPDSVSLWVSSVRVYSPAS